MSGGCCSRQATSRCRSAATPPPRGCSRAATGCATCSSGWSSGAPRPACCGWPAQRSTATSGSCCGSPRSRSSSPRPRPATGCRGRGRAATTDWDIEGGHFAERCQLFIIIALGESIVVTGATASEAGLTSTVVLCLVVAFVETAALWWLYFGATAEQRARHDEHLRRPRSPRARRLHLSPPADRRRHHRDRGRQRPAHRPATRRAARRRPGDDARRPRALPARGEPVRLADDRCRRTRGGWRSRACSSSSCRSAARSARCCSA